ncbi:hypothetical protein [Microbacterium sp.]|uniref:hypothetical protein n=1 Tax=Microbacterium sp. TaxID=51671 RepID=UPI003C75A132
MGIRYYAYAFDAEQSEQALADPDSILSDDPLADAWGLTPHAAVNYGVTFEQAVPKRDMLYLDKAWHELQSLTGPDRGGGVARPSYRMFEGNVTMEGYGWIPWVRTLLPAEMPAIARDLWAIDDADAAGAADPVSGGSGASDDYVVQYLRKARAFVAGLAADGRGMVYKIG